MTLKRKPALVVGSINMDLVATAPRIPVPGQTVLGTDFQTYPGGKGANQAVAIARLGYPVSMIGRVGNDAFGAQLRARLESKGVDVTGVLTTSASTGVALIVVSASGENSIVVAPGANAALSPADLDANIHLIHSAGLVLTQLETPMETLRYLAGICRDAGVPLMLDPAPACDLPEDVMRSVAWFTPNASEAAFYAGSGSDLQDAGVADALRRRGPAGVVLKLGSRGAFIDDGSIAPVTIRPFAVEVVDTTAAGDCFNGAFAVGLLEGLSPADSARFAAASAAISVTRRGAQSSMPDRAEVNSLLQHPDSVELEKQ